MMATTPNLNLPLIDENTVNDMPRDLNALAEAVDTAVTEAVEGVTVPDASLTTKGVVQLSNATNSTSESMAATPKAVKAAYEEATAAKQLGVEQKANVVAALNSIGVTASTSETWEQLIPKIAAVIRATGNATAADILAGKTASNASGPVTGTMPHLTGTRSATGTAKWPDGALAVYPEKGYQKGGPGGGEIKVSPGQLQSAEPNLSGGNIRKGAVVFGVAGNSPEAKADPDDFYLNFAASSSSLQALKIMNGYVWFASASRRGFRKYDRNGTLLYERVNNAGTDTYVINVINENEFLQNVYNGQSGSTVQVTDAQGTVLKSAPNVVQYPDGTPPGDGDDSYYYVADAKIFKVYDKNLTLIKQTPVVYMNANSRWYGLRKGKFVVSSGTSSYESTAVLDLATMTESVRPYAYGMFI
ncbi:phage tail protein [Mycolicibacterium fortuitum]|uniref:tail fiber protein n=1 Tax=Paenibacillus sp. FSL W8-1287 TaxID=2954653 RepID=UPI001CE09BE8|nr:tail fiber protein [Mycolicibacterium fortuitum]